MARLILRLFCDPRSAQRDILVDLASDEDATPHEHERQHKALVDGVVDGGTFRAAAEGRVAVERPEYLLPVFLGGG